MRAPSRGQAVATIRVDRHGQVGNSHMDGAETLLSVSSVLKTAISSPLKQISPRALFVEMVGRASPNDKSSTACLCDDAAAEEV